MSIMADGVKHRSLVLAAGDRNIEVLTARSNPAVREMNARVFVDFDLGDVIDDRHFIGLHVSSDDVHYTGVIPLDLQPQDYPARLRDLSFAILKDAGQRGHSSLWLNFNDRPSWRNFKQTFADYVGFLEGIKGYVKSVGDEEPVSHVSEIVIGCGMMTYRAIENVIGTQSSIMRMQAIFPASMFRSFR